MLSRQRQAQAEAQQRPQMSEQQLLLLQRQQEILRLEQAQMKMRQGDQGGQVPVAPIFSQQPARAMPPVSARLSNDRRNSSNSSLSPGYHHRNKPDLRSVTVWVRAYSRASRLVAVVFSPNRLGRHRRTLHMEASTSFRDPSSRACR